MWGSYGRVGADAATGLPSDDSPPEDPEDDRNDYADDDARGDGKIEGKTGASDDDIPRQSPQVQLIYVWPEYSQGDGRNPHYEKQALHRDSLLSGI